MLGRATRLGAVRDAARSFRWWWQRRSSWRIPTSTILATALPTIARDLGLDPISLKLAVTSYLVSLAVFIPISGWVADRVGSCTTFRVALAVFMAASIGCAYSSSLGEFVIWRAVQGIGGAMMVPVGRMVVIRAVPENELVRALSSSPCRR